MDKSTWTKYIAILGVAVLLLGYVYLKNSRYEEKQSPILEYNREDVTSFEVQRRDNAIRLESSDSLWVFAGNDTGDVAQHKVERMFDALDGMKTGFITDKAEKYATFNVDSTAMQLRVFNGDSELGHLYVGRSSANYRSDYVRYPDDPKVYITSGKLINTLGEAASFWR